MNLTDVLIQEAEDTYRTTEGLIRMVDASQLHWKPQTGRNWMTLGQLLRHCTDACGVSIKGFVTGDWSLPEGMKWEDIPPDQMLPPAEKMPSVTTIDEALRLIDEDRKIAIKYIKAAGEENLLTRRATPPWGGSERTLFQHLQSMIQHLGQHKGQLFYYLKLQGKDVNTMHLWVM
jgi:uncharacterized damage-inducible protein DinB